MYYHKRGEKMLNTLKESFSKAFMTEAEFPYNGKLRISRVEKKMSKSFLHALPGKYTLSPIFKEGELPSLYSQGYQDNSIRTWQAAIILNVQSNSSEVREKNESGICPLATFITSPQITTSPGDLLGSLQDFITSRT